MAPIRRFWHQLTPTSAFIIVAIAAGLVFCFKTPPFQVPDEFDHFYRAYQVSEGHLFARPIAGGYGDMLPSNMSDQVKYLVGNLRWNPAARYDPSNTIRNLSEPLNTNKLAPVRFEGTASYSPLAYIAQSLGVGIGRLFHVPLVVDLWLGRLSNLAFWIALVATALSLIPFGKWAMFAMALTPMSLFQAASVSPDAVLNGSAFLFVAICLRLIYAKSRASRLDYVLLLAPLAVFALTKIEYLPLALLLALIPSQRLGSVSRKWFVIGTAVAVSILLCALWSYKVRNIVKIAITPADTGLSYQIQPKQQLAYILKNPLGYTGTILSTYFTTRGDSIIQQYIGVLGWLDTVLPLWIVVLDLFLIAYCLASIKTPRGPTAGQRLVATSAGLISLIGVTTALYMYYSPVGSSVVVGLQGRYLIPLSPLLVPLAANLASSVRPSEPSLKTTAVSATVAVLLLSICVMSFRYYSAL